MSLALRIGIFSLIQWDFIHQRPHKFAEELAELGHTVFYVEPPDLSGGRLAKLGRAMQRSPGIRQVAPNIYVLRPLVIPPYRAYAHLLPYNRFLQPLAARLLRQLRLDFAIVLSPEYGPVVRALGIPFAYDHVDDTQFMEHILTGQFVRDMELLKETSAFNIYIQEPEAECDPKGLFIPNGVDLDQFYPLPGEKIFDAVVLSNIAKWFDMGSVLRTRHKVLLIGPMDIDGGNNRARFFSENHPNLFWIPQVDKDAANLWLSRAEVGLVPFNRHHPVIPYAMPIKILEYFLAGLPVVTYRSEGIRRMYGDMVTFYSSDGSDRSLDEAIEVAKQKVDLPYRDFAARYQWVDIVARLEARIARATGREPTIAVRGATSRSAAILIRRTPRLAATEEHAGTVEQEGLYQPQHQLTIAYFGASDWAFPKQRPQHLARELSRHHRVAYVRPVPLSCALRNRSWQALQDKEERLTDTLTVLRPRALSPGRLGPVARANDGLAVRAVRRHLARGVDVLWTSHPSHAQLIGKCSERLLVYDMMDNHVAFAPEGERARIDSQEVTLLSRADVVLVSSEGLKRRAAQYANGALVLVPNGVDFEHFVKAAREPLSRPNDLPHKRHFSVGFYGTLGPWVDTHLLRSIAESRPDWHLVIIGPARGAHLPPLDGLRNVHALGPKPYEQLPQYLQHVDVWIVPFARSELVDDVDPVKVYEYLAAGKPVVATALPELIKFGDLIRRADDASQFVEALNMAYEEVHSDRAPELMANRIAVARQHTWHHRANLVVEALDDAVLRPTGLR